MTIAEYCIKRPVFATVISLVILLFGALGFTYLGVREYPSIDPPKIVVRTNYPGANADVVESQITEPLEENINGVPGIRTLNSTSADGRSTITAEFDLGVDLEAAANDVRDKVSRTRGRLPDDADPPQVSKSEANNSAILAMTLQSPKRDLLGLSDIARRRFKERLQTIEGVAEIQIWGDKEYAMRLMLDPAKLQANGLTALDVRQALQRENVELPTGRVEGHRSELAIRMKGRLETQAEFNDLIIKETENALVRFKDVGEARLSALNERTILRGLGGLPMVAIAVRPQPGANQVDIADEFYRRVNDLRDDLPSDLHLNLAFDSTKPIREAIDEVQQTLFISFLLVVLVVLFFLQDARSTLIPVLAIPISLIGALFIMYLAGFSINVLTLLGLVLATGLVVDDAIVVMENIYQKAEGGLKPLTAGIVGSKEIVFAVIATTLALIGVFLPVIFLQGLIGQLFIEFGVVVAGAVVLSSVVSLTLTPMITTRIVGRRAKPNRVGNAIRGWIRRRRDAYGRSLSAVMHRKWIAVAMVLLSVGIIVGVGRELPEELAPMEDKSRLLVLSTAPEGTSYERMDAYMKKLLQAADTLPERQALIVVTSPTWRSGAAANSGFMRLILTAPENRSRSQMELASYMSAVTKNLSFARSAVIQDQTIQIGFSSGLPVQYVLQANNFQDLAEKVPIFMKAVNEDPTFRYADVDLKFNKPELNVEVDRDRARQLGVSVLDVAQTLQLLYATQRFGYYIKDGRQYEVIGQAIRSERDAPIDLREVTVRNKNGQLIAMDNLVRFSDAITPPNLYRFNRYSAATVSADLVEGKTVGEGIAAMDRIKREVLNDGFKTDLAGPSRDFAESSSSLVFAFLLALILVYLILAAQFESFIDPLLVMGTVPLALAGAVLALWLLGQSLNIFSQIGIIILIGIVTKNGILIVEFANQLMRQGYSKAEAVHQAAVRRFRPILMTSLTAALGALPIAISLGAASTSRSAMGTVLIFGLTFSLFLTLYVIPVFYVWFSRKQTILATESETTTQREAA